MRKPPSRTPPPRPLRVVVLGAAFAVGLLAIYSCSLIVETRDQQCQGDMDCTTFAMNAHCDMTSHTCVAPDSGSGSGSSSGGGSSSSSSSSGTTSSSSSSTSSTTSSGTTTSTGCDVDGGIDAGGCYSCPPGSDPEFLNACTTGCIAFDNSRVTLLDGGVLPPLSDAGPNDAGM